jgi:hypothetical protein
MDSFAERKLVQLSDGREVQLIDDGSLSILLKKNGELLASVSMKLSPAGYGGGSIHLSPSESFVLFAYHSGQSEEAFTLVNLDNDLTIVFESDYIFGEAASYCFTEDEGKLIQALPLSCDEWWAPWIDENVDRDNEGYTHFRFGTINVLDLGTYKLVEHEVRIRPTNSWAPELKEYDPMLYPEIVGENTLKISWPWGDENFVLPLPEVIIYRP